MKSAQDSPAAKSLRAAVLIYEGMHAGSIVIYYTSGQAKATITCWIGPFALRESSTAMVRGHGFDRGGSALSRACKIAKVWLSSGETIARYLGEVDAAGINECDIRLNEYGYKVAWVL